MGAEFLRHGSLAPPHGFFTRRGGVSTGPYASLNGSLSGGDDVATVLRNRALVAEALGAAPENLLGLTQVHGAIVVTVQTPWAPGAGPRADALVTDQPGLALGVITADCAPVLFADSAAGVIGAAHAGWRGAVDGVLEATLACMLALGASKTGIAAVVGPCIGQDSYEVAADLRDPVVISIEGAGNFFREGLRPARWQFDLAGYCVARLRRAGIDQVASLGVDTFTQSDRFFSHRRRTLLEPGPIGHQISAIVI